MEQGRLLSRQLRPNAGLHRRDRVNCAALELNDALSLLTLRNAAVEPECLGQQRLATPSDDYCEGFPTEYWPSWRHDHAWIPQDGGFTGDSLANHRRAEGKL